MSQLPVNALPPSEAREMWCPEVRRLGGDEVGGYVAINDEYASPREKTARCIVGRCMAWRFVDDGNTLGYCGKAGAP